MTLFVCVSNDKVPSKMTTKHLKCLDTDIGKITVFTEEHLALAKLLLFLEPTRRISVLLLFSLGRFHVNHPLISATQSERID